MCVRALIRRRLLGSGIGQPATRHGGNNSPRGRRPHLAHHDGAERPMLHVGGLSYHPQEVGQQQIRVVRALQGLPGVLRFATHIVIGIHELDHQRVKGRGVHRGLQIEAVAAGRSDGPCAPTRAAIGSKN
jgi:hypothetical protein